MRVRDLSQEVGITERAVQNILNDLELARVLVREKTGRRNTYRISGYKKLRHPVEAHCSIGDLLRLIQNNSKKLKKP